MGSQRRDAQVCLGAGDSYGGKQRAQGGQGCLSGTVKSELSFTHIMGIGSVKVRVKNYFKHRQWHEQGYGDDSLHLSAQIITDK